MLDQFEVLPVGGFLNDLNGSVMENDPLGLGGAE
jgi:hypothetical protein